MGWCYLLTHAKEGSKIEINLAGFIFADCLIAFFGMAGASALGS